VAILVRETVAALFFFVIVGILYAMNTHTCEAVVLHCIDFRFRNMLTVYLQQRFPEGYDLVSVAGSVKRLAEDSLENNFVLDQIRVSNRLHEPKTIMLIQHEDCGAYGGSKAFASFDEESNTQKSELEKAELILKKEFPQTIEKYLARLSGEIVSL